MSASTVARPLQAGRARTVVPASVRTRVLAWAVSWPVLLMAVAAAGAGMRVVALDAVGFNSDEAVYAGQAASVAGDPTLSPYFPVFRAHPMLFQTLLSLLYLDGVSDLAGRSLAVGFGVGTVIVVGLTGSLLYGRATGLLAAAVLALMPYHVIVSRQVLLDGPMAFFASVTLYLVVRFSVTGRASWLYAAGGALGLTFLAKETGALVLGTVYAYFALCRQVRVRLRDLLLASAAFLAVAAPYPLSLVFSGNSTTGSNFLAWQVFRRPNHGLWFYFAHVPSALGLAVVLLALVALVLARSQWTWRETLLVCWVVVPVVVFEIWSVKGFQYLLPIATPLALLAARGMVELPRRLALPEKRRQWVVAGIAAVTLVSLAAPSWRTSHPAGDSSFLAGSGGVPGGREAGTWVRTNVPRGAQILALGPSMANIIQFYGHRKAYGLSVSSNPLHRNPTYQPVGNPDLAIRTNRLQYVVWDSYSAGRSPYFSAQIMRYVERYHGRAVHTQSVPVDGVAEPVIVIYEVRP